MKPVWAFVFVFAIVFALSLSLNKMTGYSVLSPPEESAVVDATPLAQGFVLSCGISPGECPSTSFEWSGRNDASWQNGAFIKFQNDSSCYEVTGSDSAQFYCWGPKNCLFVSPKPKMKEGDSFSVYSSLEACESAH
ncbi:MAG: hypothetical protein V1847_04835 [Candidatus Diapherotrites archaeon]